MNGPKENDIFRPFEGETFHFNCYKEIECFTRCCARLRLILTPYDILRIKNRLCISSNDFLEKYTDTIIEGRTRFPMVRLKMLGSEKQVCPFVTRYGCEIYEDRPGACRLYPLGRASTMVAGEKAAREKYFIVNESHCLGLREEKNWSLESWLNNEGVNEYKRMNDQWLGIITSPRSLGSDNDTTRKLQMFFMASYNLDKFRKFLFESNFFDRFEVVPNLKEKMTKDEVVLMRFSFEWLKFSLFGEKTLKPKSNVIAQ